MPVGRIVSGLKRWASLCLSSSIIASISTALLIGNTTTTVVATTYHAIVPSDKTPDLVNVNALLRAPQKELFLLDSTKEVNKFLFDEEGCLEEEEEEDDDKGEEISFEEEDDALCDFVAFFVGFGIFEGLYVWLYVVVWLYGCGGGATQRVKWN